MNPGMAGGAVLVLVYAVALIALPVLVLMIYARQVSAQRAARKHAEERRKDAERIVKYLEALRRQLAALGGGDGVTK